MLLAGVVGERYNGGENFFPYLIPP